MPRQNRDALAIGAGIVLGALLLAGQRETPGTTTPAQSQQPSPSTSETGSLQVLEAAIEAAQNDLAVVQQDNQALQQQIIAAQQTIQQQQATLASLAKDISQAQATLKSLQSEAQTLSSEVSQAQGLLSQLSQDNQALQKQIPQAQAQLQQQQALITQLEATVQQLRATIQQLQAQIAQLQGEITQAQKDLAAAQQENQQIQSLLKSDSQLIANQARDLATLVGDLKAIKYYYDQLVIVTNFFAFRHAVQQASDNFNNYLQQQIATDKIMLQQFRIVTTPGTIFSAEGTTPGYLGNHVIPDVISQAQQRMKAIPPLPTPQRANWQVQNESISLNASNYTLRVKLFAIPFEQDVSFQWSAYGHASLLTLGMGSAWAFSQSGTLLGGNQVGSVWWSFIWPHMESNPGGGSKTFHLPAGVYGLLVLTGADEYAGANISAQYTTYTMQVPPMPPIHTLLTISA